MSDSTLVIPHSAFRMADPWDIPPGSSVVSLRNVTDGGQPRQATSVGLSYDHEALTLVYRATDDEVVATYLDHDEPLWEEDVVEVFLSPHDPTVYFEIEVNPLGTTFDARIDSPDGVRTSMRADLSWTCHGLFAAIRRKGEVVETVVRIPFASVADRAPIRGERWRANLFRVDRSARHGDEYSAWQPTWKKPADFHVVAAFGTLLFD